MQLKKGSLAFYSSFAWDAFCRLPGALHHRDTVPRTTNSAFRREGSVRGNWETGQEQEKLSPTPPILWRGAWGSTTES